MAARGKIIEKLFTIPVFYRMGLLLFRSTRFPRDMAIRIDSKKIYTRSLDRFIASALWKYSLSGRYERRLVSSILKPGMTAVDIGANIGFYSMLMAARVGGTGRVVAFEPDADNFRLLEKNILENDIHNVHAEMMAVAGQTGAGKNDNHQGNGELQPNQ